MAATQKWVGSSVKRREDARFLTGRGGYAEDILVSGMLYAAILRSPYAHARIKRIDSTRALRQPGVMAVVTGEDVAKMVKPVPPMLEVPIFEYPVAVNKVRYVGEPVAAVVAVSRAVAEDALDLIDVDYETLPVVIDAEKALETGAPILFEEHGSNLVVRLPLHYGDFDEAAREADLVVKERFKIHRYSSTPLETFVVTADYDAVSGVLTIWSNQQAPGLVFNAISHSLDVPGHRLRLIIPDIGGGYGIKIIEHRTYMIIIGMLAKKVGRPVKWVEDRREHLMASGHACDATFYVEAAVKRDGTLLGMKVKDIDNEGAGTLFAAYHITNKLNNLSGPYRLKHVFLDGYSVVSNVCPSAANRGIGKVANCLVWERMMDIIADRLGLDPVEVRVKNYVRPDEFPYWTPSGNLLDSGDYEATLRKALEVSEYSKWRERQEQLRREGRYIGIGLSTFTEPGGANMARHFVVAPHRLSHAGAHEAACVKVETTGKVTVALGTPCMGTGHETIVSQIVADELGVSPDDVNKLAAFDSSTHPWTFYSGTWGNNFHLAGVSAVVGAAKRLKEKVAAVAAHLLEARVDDLEMKGGRVYVRGVPEKAKTFREIAAVAYGNPVRLPTGMEPGLQVTYTYSFPDVTLPDEKRRVKSMFTHGFAAHIAVVEIGVETGQVEILRYVVVHDAGTLLNPMIVEGQTQGNALHGISAALGEGFVYDEEGQLLTGTFMDYVKPTAMDSPDIAVDHTVTPSPLTPLGNKSVGEGAACLAPAAIAGAVADALKPFGVEVTELPLTPEKVWRMMRSGKKG